MSPAAANKQSPTGDGGDRSKIGQRVGLHNLSPAPGSRRPRKRVGRGEGSGTGKTSGRGQKGAGARSGSKRRARFEGGQMPIHMRMRKLRGPLELMRANGLGTRKDVPVKVLAKGELTKALTVHAHAFSASARERIEAAGGTCQTVES